MKAPSKRKPGEGRVYLLRGEEWVPATKEDLEARRAEAVRPLDRSVQRGSFDVGGSGTPWADLVLYALRPDTTITVPEYVANIWWFVLDVNAPERTVTADTVMFDTRMERTFPFDLVETWRQPTSWNEHTEVEVGLRRLKELRKKARQEAVSHAA
ncbi:MAG: hypothetical protein ACLQBB_04365 [Solirubrobacteraceae bacterium]